MLLPIVGKIRRRIQTAYRTAFSCGLLAVYLFAFVALPVLHTHGYYAKQADTCIHHEQEESPDSPFSPVDDCSVCDVLCALTPLFLPVEPPTVLTDTAQKILPLLVSFPVADAAILPPCRAPPMES